MARHQEPNQAEEALHQIEEGFDKVASWAFANRVALGIGAALILVVAAGADFYRDHRVATGNEAAGALANVRDEFLAAMGAEPGALVFSEPANPDVAREARERFAQEIHGFQPLRAHVRVA